MEKTMNSKYKIVHADESYSERLKDFYYKTPIPGALKLLPQRVGSFFSKYKMQSEDFECLMLYNTESDTIEGVATLVARKGWIGNDYENIVYATDLRIKPSRGAVSNWGQFYLPEFKRFKEKYNAKFGFTVVSHSDTQTLNALVHTRSQRRNLPNYHLLRKFDLITIHGRVPFDRPILGVSIRQARHDDLPKIAEYLRHKSFDRTLSFEYSADFLSQRETLWPNFSIQNFMLAVDRQDSIVGCMASWDPSSIENYIVHDYEDYSKTLKSMFKLGSFLKLTKPLPEKGEPLKFQYLTHAYADNNDIFHALLDRVYSNTKKNELLIYINFYGDRVTRPPASFIATNLNFALYTITEPGETLPEDLKLPRIKPPPELEPIFT